MKNTDLYIYIYRLSEGHTKKDASIYYKCNKKTHKDILFFVNAENDCFLQLSGNQDRNKKIYKGKSHSTWGPLQLFDVFKNG